LAPFAISRALLLRAETTAEVGVGSEKPLDDDGDIAIIMATANMVDLIVTIILLMLLLLRNSNLAETAVRQKTKVN